MPPRRPFASGRCVRIAVDLEEITQQPEVIAFVRAANQAMRAMGYTEHGERHVRLVAKAARRVLAELGYAERETELAAIAGYLHDVGNMIGRSHHGQASALMAMTILKGLGMPPDEIATVVGAIGNHEEEYGEAISPVSAALILADKSDVHVSRVQTEDPAQYDEHDRVNAAVKRSVLEIDKEQRLITLQLEIDDNSVSAMEYFEIFLSRMVMCRRAAEILNCRFGLRANGQRLL